MRGPPGPPPPPGGGPAGAPPPPGPKAPIAKKPETLALHLTKFMPNQFAGTLWENLPANTPDSVLETDKLRNLFTKPTENKEEKKNEQQQQQQNTPTIPVDSKLMQGLGIFTKKFRFDPKVLQESLLSFSVLPILQPIMFEPLVELFPYTKEPPEDMMIAITKFIQDGKSEEMLDPTLRFVVKVYQVPRPHKRIFLLNYSLQFNNTIKDWQDKHQLVLDALAKLEKDHFKLILKHVLAIANTLSKGGGTIKGFHLSDLSKLSDMKSPTMKGISCLHFLVSGLMSKHPKTVLWVNKLPQIFEEAYRALAFFQSAFPTLLEKMVLIQSELNDTQKTEPSDAKFLKNLTAFKEKSKAAYHRLVSLLKVIDDKIAFFGEFSAEASADETTGSLTALWNAVAEKKLITKVQAESRLKQDMQRYNFFKILHSFFVEMKTASTYLKNSQSLNIEKTPMKKPVQPSPGRKLKDRAQLDQALETGATRKVDLSNSSLRTSMKDLRNSIRTPKKGPKKM
uniref:FH2 domain-containing protein n=1 Tax=Arcella intermedia TaxID=1963864 RepID=A0A6B2L1K4_9EUKA